MDLLLSNKVAIVTGASCRIGNAIAETLSVEDMKVVLVARSRAELEALARSLSNKSLLKVVDSREPHSAASIYLSIMQARRNVAIFLIGIGGRMESAEFTIGGAARTL